MIENLKHILVSFINIIKPFCMEIYNHILVPTGHVLSAIFTPVIQFFAATYNFIQTTPFFSKNLFNFILVVIFFIWLFKKINLIQILEDKKNEIISGIRKSEKAKKDATEHLETTQNALKNVNKDVEQIVTDAKNIAKNIEQTSETKLQNELSNLRERTEKLKIGYTQKANDEIKTNVANASLKIAEQYLKTSLDEEMHKELIYKFINNLDNTGVQ